MSKPIAGPKTTAREIKSREHIQHEHIIIPNSYTNNNLVQDFSDNVIHVYGAHTVIFK